MKSNKKAMSWPGRILNSLQITPKTIQSPYGPVVPQKPSQIFFRMPPHEHPLRPFWIALISVCVIIGVALAMLWLWPEAKMPESFAKEGGKTSPIAVSEYTFGFLSVKQCGSVAEFKCVDENKVFRAGENAYFLNEIMITPTNGIINIGHWFEIADLNGKVLFTSEKKNHYEKTAYTTASLPIANEVTSEEDENGVYLIKFFAEDKIKNKKINQTGVLYLA